MVTWNTADLTPKALRQLLDTEQGCDLRILVRDNASSDGTAEAVRREVPEAEVDAGAENLGFAAGVNTILSRSRASWILLLNSDAWPEPGAVGTLVEAAVAHPRAAAVAPRVETPEGKLEHSTHPFPSLRVAATVALLWGRLSHERADELMLEGAWLHDRLRRVDWAVGAALLLRRKAVEEIGGLDERFFMYVEDLEWCYRARRRGWEVWFEPTALVRHVGNVSGRQRFGSLRTESHLRNTLAFYRREHGAVSALAWWMLNLVGAGVHWVRAKTHGEGARARRMRSYARSLVRAMLPGEDRRPAG